MISILPSHELGLWIIIDQQMQKKDVNSTFSAERPD
jgi:hypothetical protein